MISALLSLVIVAAPGGAQRAAPAPRPAVSAVDSGRAAIDRNRFLEAARILRDEVTARPTSGEAWYLLGRAYWADDRAMSISADKAVEAFAAATALDRDAKTAWGKAALAELALAALRSERLDRAQAAYRRLLAIETRRDVLDGYRTQLEEIELDKGTYQATPAHLRGPTGEVVWPIGPLKMRTNTWFEKGRHTQDPAKAEGYYLKAIAADPVMWQAHLNYGIALARQRKFAESLAPLAEAAARWRVARPGQAEHLRAHLWRLTAFLEMDRLNEAGQEVAVITKIPERDPWAQLYVLRYLVAVGRADGAVEGIERMAADNPENVEVLYAQALAYRALGRTARATATLERAIRSIPDGHVVFGRWVAPLTRRLQEWRRPAAAR